MLYENAACISYLNKLPGNNTQSGDRTTIMRPVAQRHAVKQSHTTAFAAQTPDTKPSAKPAHPPRL